MESGKRTEAGSSASCSSASVNAEKQQKLVDMIDKSQENVDSCDKAVDEDDDSDDGVAAAFVPSPLLPLKEQLEKDKVLLLSLIITCSLFFYSLTSRIGDFCMVLTCKLVI